MDHLEKTGSELVRTIVWARLRPSIISSKQVTFNLLKVHKMALRQIKKVVRNVVGRKKFLVLKITFQKNCKLESFYKNQCRILQNGSNKFLI